MFFTCYSFVLRNEWVVFPFITHWEVNKTLFYFISNSWTVKSRHQNQNPFWCTNICSFFANISLNGWNLYVNASYFQIEIVNFSAENERQWSWFVSLRKKDHRIPVSLSTSVAMDLSCMKYFSNFIVER